MTALLPAEITSRRVVARYLNLVADGPEDPDALPDGAVPTGDVRFTRVTDGRVWADTTQTDGTTVRIAKGPIVARIDPATGEIGLEHDPTHGVNLPVGLWSVEERVAGRPAKPWVLDVTAGEGVIDLHVQAPVVPTPTTVLVPSLETMERAEAAADRAVEARDMAEEYRDDVLLMREHLGRKHPTSSLAFGPSVTARSLSVLGTRVEGVPEGTAYGIDHGWVARTTDGWASKTNGISTASANGWTHGTPGRMVAWSDGSLCLITDAYVVTMESFTTPPVATLEAEHSFWGGFSASFWEGSGQRVVLVGEYDQGNFDAKKLWLSRDGGATFAHINSTVAGGLVNNHWHATAYDPWSNAIWAASGDDQTPQQDIQYSLDWGATWSSMTADEARHLQPTLIVPFPTRVQFGRDAGLIKPGLDEWARPVSGQPVGDQPLTLGRLEFAHHLSAAEIYPSGSTWCRGRTDDEAYIAFPKRATDTSYVWATGDGGASWHLVHTSAEPIVLQSDGQRIIMANPAGARSVRVAPLLDWEWTAT